MLNLTEKIYSLKNSNDFLRNIILFSLLLLPVSLVSQDLINWKLQNTIPIPEPDQLSSDPYGNFYIADPKGNVYKYDSTGKRTNLYSPRRIGSICILDAYRNVNIFILYRNAQEYKLLNRFLTEISSNNFQNESVGFVRLACPSNDNKLWLIDDNDLSLKKLSISDNDIEITNNLALSLPPGEFDLVYMREYENQLYIADKNNGILVFDNLGNFRTRIPGNNISYFSFLGNLLYYLEKDQLITVNIKTNDKKISLLPDNLKVRRILLTRKSAFLFQNVHLHIYNYHFKE